MLNMSLPDIRAATEKEEMGSLEDSGSYDSGIDSVGSGSVSSLSESAPKRKPSLTRRPSLRRASLDKSIMPDGRRLSNDSTYSDDDGVNSDAKGRKKSLDEDEMESNKKRTWGQRRLLGFSKSLSLRRKSSCEGVPSPSESDALSERAQSVECVAGSLSAGSSPCVQRRASTSSGSVGSASSSTADLTAEIAEDDGTGIRKLSADGMEFHIQKSDGRLLIVGGALEKLVAKMADVEDLDIEFFNTFLLTFRHVIAPAAFLQMLIERIDSHSAPSNSPSIDIGTAEHREQAGCDIIVLRTTNVIVKWMSRTWYDFHNHEDILVLVDSLLERMTSRGHEALARRIRNTMAQKATEWEASLVPDPVLVHEPLNFDEITHKDLAGQLTLIELDLFRRIQSEEVIVQLWCGGEEFYAAKRNLTRYVEWFNKVSAWVSTEICLAPNHKKRAQIIERFVKVAKGCLRLSNYSTLYAIVSGLNHGAVYRMKKTWEVVSHRSLASLRELEALVDPAHNFTTYRTLLKKQRLPAIPIMGLYLKDLTFINEIPKKLNNGFVNVFKLRTVSERIAGLGGYQRSDYSDVIQPMPRVAAYCRAINRAPEHVLYQYSYLCEPRSSSLNDKLKIIENLEAQRERTDSAASSPASSIAKRAPASPSPLSPRGPVSPRGAGSSGSTATAVASAMDMPAFAPAGRRCSADSDSFLRRSSTVSSSSTSSVMTTSSDTSIISLNSALALPVDGAPTSRKTSSASLPSVQDEDEEAMDPNALSLDRAQLLMARGGRPLSICREESGDDDAAVRCIGPTGAACVGGDGEHDDDDEGEECTPTTEWVGPKRGSIEVDVDAILSS
eukprot:Opistho-2@35714